MSMTEGKTTFTHGTLIIGKKEQDNPEDCIPTVKSVRRMIRDEVRAMFLRLLDGISGNENRVTAGCTTQLPKWMAESGASASELASEADTTVEVPICVATERAME